MSRSARVRSFDALQHLAAAVREFAQEASVALDDLGMDLHRAIQWLQYDQEEYWAQQLRVARQEVAEAKVNLERRKIFKVGDHEPSCREEKMALEAAKRRMETARRKLEAVQRWTRLLEHESMECRSAVGPLAHWLQTDVPRAIALLKRMGQALESYAGVELSDRETPAEIIAAMAAENGQKAGENARDAAGHVAGDDRPPPSPAESPPTGHFEERGREVPRES